MKRLLITGAGGSIGSVLRRELAGYAEILRLSDRDDLGAPGKAEEIVQCDVSDMDAVMALVEGCDGIIHLGGMPIEDTWETILNSNIRGAYNIFEAARKTGCGRIMFASSSHAVGFYERTEHLGGDVVQRPDSLYGVSKCFGENLGQYYWDKFGVECVAVRIGAFAEKPKDQRHMVMHFSHADCVRLVKAIFDAPRVGYTVVYGVSENKEMWWDNMHASFLGYRPQDSSEPFRDTIKDKPVPERDSPEMIYQGGPFAAAGHFED